MPAVPEAAVIPQLMKKGHKIRAMLDDNLENALAELAFARQFLIEDHDAPEEDPEDASGDGGP